MTRRALVSTVAALALAAATAARAEEANPGVAVERFVPALGPGSLVGVEGAETTPPGAMSWALSLDVLHDPIVLRRAFTGELVSRPVRDAFVGDAALELGVWKRLALAVGVPVVFWQGGDRLQGTGVDERPLATTVAGDVRVRVKGTLVAGRAINAALLVEVTAPAGGQHDFAATDGATVEPRLVVDARFGRVTLAAAVGARFAQERALFTTQFGDELTWSAGAGVGIVDGTHVGLGAIVEGAGAVGASAGTRPAELRGALRLRAGPVTLDGGAGAGLDGDVGAPAWRVFLVARGVVGLTR